MYQAAPLQSGQAVGPGDVSRSRTLRWNLEGKKSSPLLGKSTIGFLKEAGNRSEVWSAALTENYGSGEDKLLTRLHRVQNLLQHWEDTVCHLHNIMQFYPYAIQADLKWQSLCNSCSCFSAHWCWTSLSHNAMASPSTLHHQQLHL